MRIENFSYRTAVAVTPSDTTDLTRGTCRGLYIGATGTVVVQTEEGVTLTLAGLAAGSILPLMVRRVLATGTTATGLHAFY